MGEKEFLPHKDNRIEDNMGKEPNRVVGYTGLAQ